MTSAWGYVRLSGRSGNSPDAGIEEQKRSIRDYCRDRGLDLQTTRNDGERTSGFDRDRDEYTLLREKIDRGDVDAVVTRDRARLARDFDERLWLITAMRRSGVEWHVVEAGGRLGLDDVQQAGFECVHAMMDHVKKMVEIDRSRKAMEARVERGCYQGYPPAGLTFADDGCHLEPDGDWAAVQSVLDMDADGGVERRHIIEEVDGLNDNQVDRIRNRGRGWYAEIVADYVESAIEV
jgi:DNA invertase Pin-like site-specific DNA recombinase